jgi:hypothetical protein
MDATRILKSRTIRRKLEGRENPEQVIASTDMVAVGAYATTLFGIAPKDISITVTAANAGLGRWIWESKGNQSIKTVDRLIDYTLIRKPKRTRQMKSSSASFGTDMSTYNVTTHQRSNVFGLSTYQRINVSTYQRRLRESL